MIDILIPIILLQLGVVFVSHTVMVNTVLTPSIEPLPMIKYMMPGLPSLAACSINATVQCKSPPTFHPNTDQIYSISGRLLVDALDYPNPYPVDLIITNRQENCHDGTSRSPDDFFHIGVGGGLFLQRMSCDLLDTPELPDTVQFPCYCRAETTPMNNQSLIIPAEFMTVQSIIQSSYGIMAFPAFTPGECKDKYILDRFPAVELMLDIDPSYLYRFRNDSTCQRSFIRQILFDGDNMGEYPCGIAGNFRFTCIRVTSNGYDTMQLIYDGRREYVGGSVYGIGNVTVANAICVQQANLVPTNEPTYPTVPPPSEEMSTASPTSFPSDAPTHTRPPSSSPTKKPTLRPTQVTFSPTEADPPQWFALLHYTYDTIANKPTTYGFDGLKPRIFQDVNVTWSEFIHQVSTLGAMMGSDQGNCNDWKFDEMGYALNVTTRTLVPQLCEEPLPLIMMCANP
jgi:hypothetical protein